MRKKYEPEKPENLQEAINNYKFDIPDRSNKLKYRKKPVVIEAFQWRGQDVPEYNQAIVYPEPNKPGNRVLLIPTLEGQMQASMGDYIITGIKGEIYPCKPDIFEATYEAVEG